MTINGDKVQPKYNEQDKVLSYTPSQPLSAGSYKVSCKVVVDDCLPVTKSWNFTVSDSAIVSLPQPSSDQERQLNEINKIRDGLGLPAFEIDARLCAAAMAHTNYLARNGLTGHYENPKDPAFVGNAPGDRLDAFGFSQSSWEGVDYGPHTASESIQRLYDAPYHRLPFLQPGTTYAGSGFLPTHMTVEFGTSEETDVVVSPANGQTDIPLSWHGPEMPDPLAIHGVDGTCGYPLVFSYFTPTMEKIVVDEASLETAQGVKVPFWLNTPSNDKDLNFAAFVLPKKALLPNTGYVVSVEAHTASGKDISRAWRFVTGGR
jgi:uncharacterized protein YkwD